MAHRTEPWRFVIDHCQWLWFGRRLWVVATFVNRTAVASTPDARRLRPTLRDVRGHALAVSELYRPDEEHLTIFRPVVDPGASVQVRLQFERLPDDRLPAFLSLGDETLPLPVLEATPAHSSRASAMDRR